MDNNVASEVAKRLTAADSVLIALPINPNVDELATAIGLSLLIDKMGKKVTTIYSGETPNALEFLKPSEHFEKNVTGLQDFVIAINKDKADHLRYKIDGDYVKVFITPYKSSIVLEDLGFSYGDFNVDLVIAMNVPNEEGLDKALAEYGRILHSASIVNVSLDPNVRFGQTVWCEAGASSLAEMVGGLSSIFPENMDADIATALLTGIVANTKRFSNEKTTPKSLQMAGVLMAAGANQQLISSNMEEKLVSLQNTTDTANIINVTNATNTMNATNAVSAVSGGQGFDASINVEHGSETSNPAEGGNNLSATISVNNVPVSNVPKTDVSADEGQAKISKAVEESRLPKAGDESKPKMSDVDPRAEIDKAMNEILGGGSTGGNSEVATEIEKGLTGGSKYVGSNPALNAAPSVNEEAVTKVPTMSYGSAGTNVPAEKALGEESYLKQPDIRLEKPVAIEDESVVVKPMSQENVNSGVIENGGFLGKQQDVSKFSLPKLSPTPSKPVSLEYLKDGNNGTGVLPPPKMPEVNPLPMPSDLGVTPPPAPPPLVI